MQTYQMAIMLLFENVNMMTCKEIQDTLELNNETFQKHMQSLIEAKLLIASSEQLEGSAAINLNLDYTNKRTKFKISAALQRETPQEVEHTMSAVDEDRKLYLQAAIVRIMKSRKILKHNALIQEVIFNNNNKIYEIRSYFHFSYFSIFQIISQSKSSFSPNIPMIKKCIESLIDKQYIERTPTGSDEYSYVA